MCAKLQILWASACVLEGEGKRGRGWAQGPIGKEYEETLRYSIIL
jgi:hypothetical protein